MQATTHKPTQLIELLPPVTIAITDDDEDTCFRYAETVRWTNLDCYARRGQGDIDKLVLDNVYGKLAELATARLLNASMPDFTILDASSKSFAADLETCDGKLIHVKSQTSMSAYRYGQSWMFEKVDPVTYRPTEADHIVVCLTKPEKQSVIVLNPGLLPAVLAKPFYAKPVKLEFRVGKHCLYGDDLRAANLLVGGAAIA